MAGESVWLRPRRRERQTLTLDRIVAEAVALLDEEGEARLTMRRLAERLDTGSTTLYWHVKTKDDVLDLALDAVFGEVPLPAPEGGWRERAAALAAAWRAALLRHPWTTGLLDRPMMGPNALSRTEFLYATLAEAGFGAADLPAAAFSLSTYVTGSATMQARAQDSSGAALREHLRAQREAYPVLAAHGLDHDWDVTFARGLAYLLDGMADRLG
ncbi:TetR/AcrR family transcriptional regulator [Nonomuraea rhodomycinica]|uniref:TetR/AcrR family transcriptional regulator n=1 Tax=Nonomuraea rhodomycinica TaxID=1712872 RepID=A0A7Y6IJ45_9ACTN|nr:TetR/AcrR family transcriptional regulator C-terminal domain-containing protein [Nonomuraea rhodomycinica]NUW38620.1 TetR/AcrR family transcriptional regulator [Nonomuraea rhodomycinica]